MHKYNVGIYEENVKKTIPKLKKINKKICEVCLCDYYDKKIKEKIKILFSRKREYNALINHHNY